MTALIEFKQKLKNLYGRLEIYLLPILKFAVAMVFFTWINKNLGYMTRLNNIFVVLVLALVSSILPTAVMTFFGFVLVIGHAYAICLEAGAFALVLVLFISMLFLRFSGGQNLVLVCAPLGFAFEVPALIPIGSGLLGNAFSVFPAVSSVIFYYFVRLLRSVADSLGGDIDMLSRVRILADGFVLNWAMWLTVLAFLVTILLVNLIRTRSINYAWKIAIILGGICYIAVMLVGSRFLRVTVSLPSLLIQTAISVLVGLVIEFFFFGGDYKRTEHLQYEDDEYYYYVKAVPKTFTASERSAKKAAKESPKPEEKEEEPEEEEFYDEEDAEEEADYVPTPIHQEPDDDVEDVDFERQLEESLKDL